MRTLRLPPRGTLPKTGADDPVEFYYHGLASALYRGRLRPPTPRRPAVRNPVTDGFFRLAGYNPRALHPSSHREILAGARRAQRLAVLRVAGFRAALPLACAGYAGCLLQAA